MLEPLIRSLERRDRLTSEEKALIAQLQNRRRSFQGGEELVSQGSRPRESCLVLSGFTARAQFLSDGRRQISAVHIAGDFVDLHALLLKVMDHSVVALRRCEAAFVPHDNLLEVIQKAPHLGRMFWLSTVVDAAIQRTWITNIGRRPPTQHIAHLLCELYMRLDTVGLVREGSFEFPPTQGDIADMLGLSVVHVNRTIQELRSTGLVKWSNNIVAMVDLERLQKLAEFDPTYLNLVNEPR